MNAPDVIVAWLQNDYGQLGRPAEAMAHAMKAEGLARNVAYIEPFAPGEQTDLRVETIDGVDVYRGVGTPPVGGHEVADALLGHSGLERPLLLNCGAVQANWWMHYELGPVVAAEVVVLHDRIAEWDAFAAQAPRLRELRRLLARGADAVCGLSQGSIADLPGSTYVGHGVDAHWTVPGAGDVPEPPELAAIPGPRAVYVGALSVRIDVEAVRALAASGIHVVLVGFDPSPALQEVIASEPGVHFLGPRRPEETPALLVHADVGIIPHTDEPFTHSMEPHKAYNYSAAGLRTVTINTTTAPALDAFVTTTTDVAAFVAAVRVGIDAGRLDDADVAYARSITWGSVAARLLAVAEGVRRPAV